MDLKKLEYFFTVAKEGHLTKAAKLLHISQPPLTYQLKAFEKEIGMPLFEKDGRHIKLTEQGRFLYEKAPSILGLVSSTMESLKAINHKLEKPLTIGNASPWAYTILPQQIHAFKKTYPNTKFQMWQGDTHHIIDLLNKGTIEIGFITMPTKPELYESKLLHAEHLYAFFGDEYKYGHADDCITLDEMVDCPAITFNHQLYDLIAAYYKHVVLEPKLILQNDAINGMLDCTATQPWIAIGPKSVFDFSPISNIKYKLITKPHVDVGSYIVWLKNRALSKTSQKFVEMILETFPSLSESFSIEILQLIGDSDWLRKKIIS